MTLSSSSRFVRAVTLSVLVLVAVVSIVTIRELSIGREEVGDADAAAAKSDWPEAIAHARAAAEALVPGSPWPERGRRRLEAIGHDAEARGDDETALLAYGAMRTVALATCGLASASGPLRSRAEEGLARVASSQHEVGMPKITPEAMLEALRRTETPATPTLTILGASVVAMLTGLAGVAWSVGRARVAEAVAALGFVTYVIVLLVN